MCCLTDPTTGLPKALHNVLHVVVVDVVSLQQAAVAGPLHGELRGRKQNKTKNH